MSSSLRAMAASLGLASVLHLAFVLSALAQMPDSPDAPCIERRAQLERRWSESEHTYVSDVLHREFGEIAGSWCDFRHRRGLDRLPAMENFAQALFTGEGLHPVIGSVAPGTGTALGLNLNLTPAATRSARFLLNGETRGAADGSWRAGLRFGIEKRPSTATRAPSSAGAPAGPNALQQALGPPRPADDRTHFGASLELQRFSSRASISSASGTRAASKTARCSR